MAMVEKKPATADNLGASGNPWDCVWHHSHNCPTSTAWGTPDSELRGWAEPSVARLVRGARTGRQPNQPTRGQGTCDATPTQGGWPTRSSRRGLWLVAMMARAAAPGLYPGLEDLLAP